MSKRRNPVLHRLPPLRINLSSLMAVAENGKERVTMESLIDGVGYVSVAGEGTVIISKTNGYLKIDEENLPMLIEELTEISDQMRIRRTYNACY